MQDNTTMHNTANPGRLTTTAASTHSDRQLRPRKKPASYTDALEDTDIDGLEQHIAAWSQYEQPQAAVRQPSVLAHSIQADIREKNLWPSPIFFAPFTDSPTDVEMRFV